MGETLGIAHNVFEKMERERDRKERLKKVEDWNKEKQKKKQRIKEMQMKVEEQQKKVSTGERQQPQGQLQQQQGRNRVKSIQAERQRKNFFLPLLLFLRTFDVVFFYKVFHFSCN